MPANTHCIIFSADLAGSQFPIFGAGEQAGMAPLGQTQRTALTHVVLWAEWKKRGAHKAFTSCLPSPLFMTAQALAPAREAPLFPRCCP